MKDDTEGFIAGNYQVTAVLTDKRQITITRYIRTDQSKKEIDASMAIDMELVNRQFVRADVVNKKAQRTAGLQRLQAQAETFERLMQKAKGEQLATMEQTKVENYDTTVAEGKAAMERLNNEIIEAEKFLDKY